MWTPRLDVSYSPSPATAFGSVVSPSASMGHAWPPPVTMGRPRVWDASSGRELLTLAGHVGLVFELGRFLASPSAPMAPA